MNALICVLVMTVIGLFVSSALPELAPVAGSFSAPPLVFAGAGREVNCNGGGTLNWANDFDKSRLEVAELFHDLQI